MRWLDALLHRIRRGHVPFWFYCCYDGMGWLWSCSRCNPERVAEHPRAAHGWWR